MSPFGDPQPNLSPEYARQRMLEDLTQARYDLYTASVAVAEHNNQGALETYMAARGEYEECFFENFDHLVRGGHAVAAEDFFCREIGLRLRRLIEITQKNPGKDVLYILSLQQKTKQIQNDDDALKPEFTLQAARAIITELGGQEFELLEESFRQRQEAKTQSWLQKLFFKQRR